MAQDNSRWSYLAVAFVTLLVGAQAIHWFISPASASASTARWWAVLAQAVAGIGVGCWLAVKGLSAARDN